MIEFQCQCGTACEDNKDGTATTAVNLVSVAPCENCQKRTDREMHDAASKVVTRRSKQAWDAMLGTIDSEQY